MREIFGPGLEARKAGNRGKGPGWVQRNDVSMEGPPTRDTRRVHADKGSHKRALGPTQCPPAAAMQSEVHIPFILTTSRFRGALDGGPRASSGLNAVSLHARKYLLWALDIVDSKERQPSENPISECTEGKSV